MKLIGAAFCLSAMCAAGVAAQTTEVKSKTKIEVKDGMNINVSGCLAKNPGGGYMLTNDIGGLKYALVTDDDLSKHLGHKVGVRGKATDRGDARVTIESVVGTSGSDEFRAKTDARGDLAGMHYLGVKSVKMISSICP